jgi:hypothetical protein
VIALMKRAKGATLAEIVEATAGRSITVRGFLSILGSKGSEKIGATAVRRSNPLRTPPEFLGK